MYIDRDHAPDSVIGSIVRKLSQTTTDGYAIAQALSEEGCQLTADGSGYVKITLGKEVCFYPLNVTELPIGIGSP